MDKPVAGEYELLEYSSLCRAATIHKEAAVMFEQHGMQLQAGEEWAKCALICRAMNSWLESWEFPKRVCNTSAAYKEKKSGIAERMSLILREHMGMGRGLAADVADALVRGRDLPALARQKGWDLDGTALAVGCEKIRRIGIRPDYMPYVDALLQLAQSIGIDQDAFDAAIEFIDETEQEDRLEKTASRIAEAR